MRGLLGLAVALPTIGAVLPMEADAAGAGIDVTKNADPTTPLTGTIVIHTGTANVTLTTMQDFYEVHYPGNSKPAGCGLVAGETLTGNPGDHGWFALSGTANGVNLNTYTIQFNGSPALNPATTTGSSQRAGLSLGTTQTWTYTTQGTVGVPAECVVNGANAPNSMRNVIVITTNLGTALARSVSFPPVFQQQTPPPPPPPPPPPLPPPPADTPELDSLALFGSGLTGMGGYVLARLRSARRRK